MPESPSEILERFHEAQLEYAKYQGKTSQKIETLEKENGLVWSAIDKGRDTFVEIREQLSKVRIQVAGIVGVISIIQTLVVSWIVYKTKGG